MTQQPSRTLTWLHLSDAHIGDARHAPDAEHVLETLVQDLRCMQRDRRLRPDMVFFTGDAAFGDTGERSLAAQYAEVARFFDGVRTAFDPPIPKECVFIVPGNHDVNRNETCEDQREWLDNLLLANGDAEEKVNAMIRKGNVQWKRFMERLHTYRDFLAGAGYTHLLGDQQRLTFVHRLQVGQRSVGIVGLNTAWSCSDDNGRGRVWLGRWQFTSLHAQLRGCTTKIVLSHHPFSWLTECEEPHVSRDISQMFHFHLHGHEHDDWIVEARDHTRIAAGACYDRIAKPNGYNIVSVALDTGITDVHLRRYDRQGRGWVPRCVHGRTNDRGIWQLQRLDRLRAGAPGSVPPVVPAHDVPVVHKPRPISASDYFSPAREITDADKFVGRRKELAKAVAALRSEGASIAIFGHAGLGKSSLAFQIAHLACGDRQEHLAELGLAHLVPEQGFAHPVVYYCCQPKDHTLFHVLTAVLRDSHPPFSTRAALNNAKVERELALPENRQLAAKIEAIRMSAAESVSEGASSLPADARAIFCELASVVSKAHDGRSLVVVLDEFNVVADKTGTAALLKELHCVTFVLVGTAVDIRLLVRDHASVPRQLEEGQIRIREMDASDLKEIVRREEGRAKGAFRFTTTALLQIVQTASGMPYFVHLLGRYALAETLAQQARPVNAELVVDREHVERALANSAEHMADLEASYVEIIAGSWQRELILKLLACRAESEVMLTNIMPMAKSQGVPRARTQVGYFVSKNVLEELPGNAVRFKDPRLRVFVRLRTPISDANRRRLEFVRADQQRLGAEDWVFSERVDRERDRPGHAHTTPVRRRVRPRSVGPAASGR